MSICSDQYISRKEAEKMVKGILIDRQTLLIEKALESMNDWELTSYINDGDLYYYNIIEEDENE